MVVKWNIEPQRLTVIGSKCFDFFPPFLVWLWVRRFEIWREIVQEWGQSKERGENEKEHWRDERNWYWNYGRIFLETAQHLWRLPLTLDRKSRSGKKCMVGEMRRVEGVLLCWPWFFSILQLRRWDWRSVWLHRSAWLRRRSKGGMQVEGKGRGERF